MQAWPASQTVHRDACAGVQTLWFVSDIQREQLIPGARRS